MTDVSIRNDYKKRDFTYAYAGFFIRMVAFLIDMAIIGAIESILNSLIFDRLDISILGFNLRVITSLIISLAYFSILAIITKGRSLGKIICGLRVVSRVSDELSLSQILIREIGGRYVQNKFYILYLLVGLNKEKLSLIDMLLDTAVVKEDIYTHLYKEKN